MSNYRKIHVMGISGQECRAVFDYLISIDSSKIAGHESVSREDFVGNFTRFSDAYEASEVESMLQRILNSGSELYFKDDYLKGIESGDLVIFSQAYRRYKNNEPLISRVASGDVFMKQAIEIVFDLIPCRSVGVTGTAGKSTVTHFIRSIVETAGINFYFSGNDRDNKWDLPALESLSEDSIAIFEISHRHLLDLKKNPDVSVITNIYPHHLDDLGTFENYIEDKKNIFRYQNKSNTTIINQSLIDSGFVRKEEVKGELKIFGNQTGLDAGIKSGTVYLKKDDEDRFLVDLNELIIGGEHGALNASAAALACDALHIAPEIIRNGLMAAKPLKYRNELIACVNDVCAFNDGKSSDPIATIEAVRSVPSLKALILGGVREGGKPGDFVELGKEINKRGVPRIIVYGRSRNLILEDFKPILSELIKIEEFETLKEALKSVPRIMSKMTGSVLFSPSCQSFDEFKDYRERAELFNDFVKEWLV